MLSINYCLILKLLSDLEFLNIPTAEFGMISAETACWDSIFLYGRGPISTILKRVVGLPY
jgi:hypothetical protein